MTNAWHLVMIWVMEHCADKRMDIVMTRFMEHCDDNDVEHCDDKRMAHCHAMGHGVLR